MNNIKRFLNSLDQDQKDVLKSSLIVIILSGGIATFLDGHIFLIFILFPLQLIVTGKIFANRNIIIGKDLCLDKKSEKRFSHSTTVFIAFGGILLIILSIIASACLEESSFLAFFVLFIPLFITRAIVFFYKLPLSVMYPSLSLSGNYAPSTTQTTQSTDHPIPYHRFVYFRNAMIADKNMLRDMNLSPTFRNKVTNIHYSNNN